MLDKMVVSICSCRTEFLCSLWAVLTASSQHRCSEKHLLWCWEVYRSFTPLCVSSLSGQWQHPNRYPMLRGQYLPFWLVYLSFYQQALSHSSGFVCICQIWWPIGVFSTDEELYSGTGSASLKRRCPITAGDPGHWCTIQLSSGKGKYGTGLPTSPGWLMLTIALIRKACWNERIKVSCWKNLVGIFTFTSSYLGHPFCSSFLLSIMS